jgi:hypothetical protein
MSRLSRWWIRCLALAVLAAAAAPRAAQAIPAWARKYNMNCSGCHYPVVPRLNAEGLAFKWAGYRMPDEIGTKVDVQKIENYLAARGIARYAYSKARGASADTNAFRLPNASLFAAGPFGANYAGYLEFEREEEGSVDLVGQVTGVWGREGAFGGLRFVRGHLLVGGAVAGFDRPVGIAELGPVAAPTTLAVPFTFGGDQTGLEASYVLGKRNRTSIGVVNAVLAEGETGGEEMEGGLSTKKDAFVTNQWIWDELGGGLTTAAYLGRVVGLSEDAPAATSRYYRLAASANRYFGPVELGTGIVYGRDRDLPLGDTSPFVASTMSGVGYWLSGGYTLPKRYWTVYSRYERLDPDRDAQDQAVHRLVFGSVLPVSLPEYLRLGIEYVRDAGTFTGAPRRQGVNLEALLAF